jgi:transcriptional regulator with XRE-family HTH domain
MRRRRLAKRDHSATTAWDQRLPVFQCLNCEAQAILSKGVLIAQLKNRPNQLPIPPFWRVSTAHTRHSETHALPSKNPPHPVDKHVGGRLRLRRKLQGMSQADLAKGLKLTFQQVQKYERGANRISASTLYELAGLLRTQPAWFFEGLPATDTGAAVSPEDLEAGRAVQALMTSPDGLALAQLLSGLETQRRRQILALMELLAEPVEPRKVA